MNIIANKKLRKLFQKGYSFIEPIYVNKPRIFQSLKSDVNDYLKNLSTKFSVNLTYFDHWKVTILEKIKDKVFSTKILPKRTELILMSEQANMSTIKNI